MDDTPKAERRSLVMEPLEEVVEIDARGLYCPLPVLRLAKALRATNARRYRLLATDPAAAADVESFCRETGSVLLETRREKEVFVFELGRGA